VMAVENWEMHKEALTLFDQADVDGHLHKSSLLQQASQTSPQPNPSLSDIFSSTTQELDLPLNDSFILYYAIYFLCN